MQLSDINSLDINEIGLWPAPAKAVILAVVMVVVIGLGYWFDLSSMMDSLRQGQRQEQQLKQEYKQREAVAANIGVYQQRLKKLKGMLADLVKQLPTGTEMPDLLERVSDLGRSNGLLFRVFQPQRENRQDYFVVVPIAIRAQGTYHQFGEFISSISAMQRIVTLRSATLSVPSGKPVTNLGNNPALSINATLQTYRYVESSNGKR